MEAEEPVRAVREDRAAVVAVAVEAIQPQGVRPRRDRVATVATELDRRQPPMLVVVAGGRRRRVLRRRLVPEETVARGTRGSTASRMAVVAVAQDRRPQAREVAAVVARDRLPPLLHQGRQIPAGAAVADTTEAQLPVQAAPAWSSSLFRGSSNGPLR